MTEILRAGVMGWPIDHSRSPRLHGTWLTRHGIEGSYEAVASSSEHFEADLRGLVAAGWRGVNVTLPHKEAALALADEATPQARAIGAANTLIFTDEGRILADNTDGFGFIENLHDGAGSAWSSVAPALVLGAGGAARAIIHALIAAGATDVRIANRTKSRAEALAAAFGPPARAIEWDAAPEETSDVSLIVNTTSLGMKGAEPLSFDLGSAPSDAVVTDIVYSPLETDLLRAARGRGLLAVDGLGMLLHQARPGFAAWFGVEPKVDDALRAAVLAS